MPPVPRHIHGKPMMRLEDAEMRQIKSGSIIHGSGQMGVGRGAAFVEQFRQTGYRPLPVDENVRSNAQVMEQLKIGEMLRERKALEGTNLVVQSHPIQDSPFLGIDIHYASAMTTVVPNTVDSVFTVISQLETRFVAIIRNIDIITYDAAADDELTFKVLVNQAVQQGDQSVSPDALFGFRMNSSYRVMENQSMSILITNTSAINPHDVKVVAYGWKYPIGDVIETPRGIMPNVK